MKKAFNIAGSCISGDYYMLQTHGGVSSFNIVSNEFSLKNFSEGDVRNQYAQLVGYIDRPGLQKGWMLMFDEDKAKPWNEKPSMRFGCDRKDVC